MLQLAWHVWYGHQKGCDPFGVDHGHDDDWEQITVNFVLEAGAWLQDSVTFHQHSGHYTRSVRFIEISFCSNKSNRFAGRYNVDAQPNVWVGKIAHGSYDNWCDGHGLVRNI